MAGIQLNPAPLQRSNLFQVDLAQYRPNPEHQEDRDAEATLDGILNEAEATVRARVTDPEAQQQILATIRAMRGTRATPQAISNLTDSINNHISIGAVASLQTHAQIADYAIYSRLPISAAGRMYANAYSHAMRSNNLDTLVQLTMQEREADFPNLAARRQVRAAVEEYLHSPTFTQQRQQIMAHDPQELEKQPLRRRQRYEAVQDYIKQHPESDVSRMLAGALRNGVFDQHESIEIVEALQKGTGAEQLRPLLERANRAQERTSIREPRRVSMERDRSAFLESLTPEQRSKYETPEAREKLITQLVENEDAVRAVHQWQLRHRDEPLENMPAAMRQTYLAMVVRSNSRNFTQREFEIRELEFMRDMRLGIEKAVSTGQDLSADQQSFMKNLQYIDDPKQPIQDRALRMVESAGERMLQAQQEAGLEGLSREAQLGRAVITLGFTDQNGGMQRYQEMRLRFNANRADPEASAYMRSYREYMQRTLVGDTINRSDRDRNILTQNALESLGERMTAGSVRVQTVNGDLRFFDRNSTNFEGTASYMSSPDDARSRAAGGIVRALYTEIHSSTPADQRSKYANDPEYVRLIRDIDTYRLQTDPRAQDIIDGLFKDGSTHIRYRARVDELIHGELAGMQPYAAQVLAQANPLQRELLQRYNAINADGALDIKALMQRIDQNKATDEVFSNWRANVTTPREKLSPVMREARELAELGTLLRAAHSIEHLAERGNHIEDALHGERASTMLKDDQRLYSALMAYDPTHATPEQRKAFHGAIREFLMRDEYMARKERGDAKLPEGERANIVQRTTAMIEERLRQNPNLFRGEQEGHDHDHDEHEPEAAAATRQVSQPVKSPVPAGELPAPIPQPVDQQPDRSWRNDRREREGAGGLGADFDMAHTNPMERALRQVRGTLSPDVWHSTLVPLIARQNEGDLNYASINEVEKALKRAGVTDPGQIADVNGSKTLDIEDIQAKLTPVAAGKEQGSQRS